MNKQEMMRLRRVGIWTVMLDMSTCGEMGDKK